MLGFGLMLMLQLRVRFGLGRKVRGDKGIRGKEDTASAEHHPATNKT